MLLLKSAVRTLVQFALLFRSAAVQDGGFSGELSMWTDWSEWSCSATCGKNGAYRRTRTCIINDGTVMDYIDAEVACGGVADESKDCPNLQPCPDRWSAWGNWGKCSVSCGEGVRERMRNCERGDKCLGESVDSKSCNVTPHCPTDGSWGIWSPWSACSQSCGEDGVTTRLRECDSPSPRFGGKDCIGSSEMTARCNVQCCPQNGGWGTWNEWGRCTRTCGIAGARIRKRLCNDPMPSPEPCPGEQCLGSDTGLQECNRQPCPIDGGWCAWSTWTICSTTCSQGVRRRSRNCASPSPNNGGDPCPGDSSEAKTCVMAPFCPMVAEWSRWIPISRCPDECGEGCVLIFTRHCQPGMFNFGSDNCPGNASMSRVLDIEECPVVGRWSYWSCWSSCAATCGRGIRTRHRHCNNPFPTSGTCQGRSEQEEGCFGAMDECPVDGGWSPWEDWGRCTQTCSGGFRCRFRRCDSPMRSDHGTYCPGTNRQLQDCGNDPCVINGDWSTWSCWGSCSVTCGTHGVRRRERSCSNPSPASGGSACNGSRTETKDCDGMPACAMDGGWSPWSEWSEHEKSCGKDVARFRVRHCSEPKPENGGRNCDGQSTDVQVVDLKPCPTDGYWTEWSCWSACTATCSYGVEEKTRMCVEPMEGGEPCDGPTNDTRSCNEGPCAVDGAWRIWGAWTICSKTCGRGFQNRRRTCDEPSPLNGGFQCEGERNQVRMCVDRGCPVDGNWSEWSSWSSCSVTCDVGTRTRNRTCANPSPINGGLSCRGNDLETGECEGSFRCRVDGGFSNWARWGDCSQTCNGGIKKRTRTCSRPFPVTDGLVCDGPRTEYENCSKDIQCPCDGHWSVWGQWSDCSVSGCGMTGIRLRERTCDAPPAVAGGSACSGAHTQMGNCSNRPCRAMSEWSEWSDWSDCSSTCGNERLEQQSRTRTCVNDDMETCSGSSIEYRFCKLPACPANCVWTEWSCWAACSVTCGIGQRLRSRNCTSPPNKPCEAGDCRGSSVDFEECDAHCCPQDGGWSSWSTWTVCSKTCGCDGYQTRSRPCSSPTPKCGGYNCDGSNFESRRCNDKPCPIDGSWSEWGCWSTCSATCGSGSQTAIRNCTNPAPHFGGYACAGNNTVTQICSPRPCLADGEWTEWSPWTDCSHTCGESGYQTRHRQCDYPLPNSRGLSCEGPTEDGRSCSRVNCPRDGGWSAWTRWSDCGPCGPSSKSRTRFCINPSPSDGGADCSGPRNEFVYCQIVPCSVDGGWTSWSEWTICSKTCGGGTRNRGRSCNKPIPMFGGLNCRGPATDSMNCNTQPCPCDGDWSEWSDHGCCSAECGTGGTKLRVRSCGNPSPTDGGRMCLGPTQRTELCSRLHLCPIDGRWSQWGSWSFCSKTCGVDGRRTRERQCNNPEPERGGSTCPGAAVENHPCNFLPFCPCEGGWSDWGQWSVCSVSVGTGTQRIYRTCTNPTPNNTDSVCEGEDEMSRLCHFNVPGDGEWCKWASWSPCPVTCGDTLQTRRRKCDCPAPTGAGRNCDGAAGEVRIRNLPNCPIDGSWTNWGCWGPCSSTCGKDGVQYRHRTCTNPAPRFDGSSCLGLMTEQQPCFPDVLCAPERKWSAWGQWSECSASCGRHITRERTRVCLSSGEDTGGNFCPGSATVVHSCELQDCPLHGGYTGWSHWGDCSVTCGKGGMRSRRRRCISPPPANGGDVCSREPAVELQTCSGEGCCKIDGSWSPFGEFSACSRTCNGGFRVAYQYCNNPEPQCGGKECEGPSSKLQPCNKQACPCNGDWSEWSTWPSCDKTCGAGTRVRTRRCNNPAPANGGEDCIGSSADVTDCFVSACLVDCEWSPWREWNPCNKPCGSDATKERKRSCTCPERNGKGLNCVGPDADHVVCDLLPCPCDGGWSVWGQWSPCSVSCQKTAHDHGFRTRKRACTNPEPTGRGLYCLHDASGLNDSETAICELLHPCPVDGGWGEWLPWSSCSKTCGIGVAQRKRVCNNPEPANKGSYCPGTSIEVRVCNNHSCPCDGGYGFWGPWTACSVTCGGGYKARLRYCANPVPAYGGKDCEPTQQKQTTNCFQPFQCPRDGTWTQWSSWSLCSVYCGHGVRQRFRSCQNPGFSHRYMEGQQLPGRNCPGKSHDIETCHQECINDNVVRCCEPQPLTDGRSSVSYASSHKATDVGYVVGTVIKYECDSNVPGLILKLIGPRTRRCMSNGQWSDRNPQCEVVSELTSDRFRRSPTSSDRALRLQHDTELPLNKASTALKKLRFLRLPKSRSKGHRSTIL